MTALETHDKCEELKIENMPATKILYAMLNNYVNDGTTYVRKELRFFAPRDTMPRKFVVNLYNDKSKEDHVLIRVAEE